MDFSRTLEIIIARYKENIDWVNSIKYYHTNTVYNKFYEQNIKLKNVGREGHTYLYHIYHRYDSLSDINLFTQGDPLFHDSNIINQINNLDFNKILYPFFFGAQGIENGNGNFDKRHPNGLPIYYFLDFLFNKKISPETMFSVPYGAIFLVSKEKILHRPKAFYKFLLDLLSSEIDPIEGYIIERLWPFIFDDSLELSCKYKRFVH